MLWAPTEQDHVLRQPDLAEARGSHLVCRLTYNDDVVRQTPDQLAVFQGDEHPRNDVTIICETVH
jgi:hypothetical protein